MAAVGLLQGKCVTLCQMVVSYDIVILSSL